MWRAQEDLDEEVAIDPAQIHLFGMLAHQLPNGFRGEVPDVTPLPPVPEVNGPLAIRVVYPTGEEETLLKSTYNFNWQLTYILDKPKPMPKGTKIFVTAWYDNSANNLLNPDPTKEVRWGEQSWEEMMISTATFRVDGNKTIERAGR